MANICKGQSQIHIILPWIIKVINKIVKKAIKCLGNDFPPLAYCLHSEVRVLEMLS